MVVGAVALLSTEWTGAGLEQDQREEQLQQRHKEEVDTRLAVKHLGRAAGGPGTVA